MHFMFPPKAWIGAFKLTSYIIQLIFVGTMANIILSQFVKLADFFLPSNQSTLQCVILKAIVIMSKPMMFQEQTIL